MAFREAVAREWKWTLGLIGITALIALLITLTIKPNLFTRVLAVAVVLAVIGLGATLLAFLTELATLSKSKADKQFGNIAKVVPINQAWVLRWFFGSNPETLDGYVAKREGLAVRIPVLQLDEGAVDLSPQERNPTPMTVRSKDNQLIRINYWHVWRVKDPCASKARTRDPERLVDQTILTHCAGLASQIPAGILGTISIDHFTDVFTSGSFRAINHDRRDKDGNPLPAEEETFVNDGKDRLKAINSDLEYFGLEVMRLKFEQIIPPESQVGAAEARTEQRIRKEAMAQEADAVKHFSQEVGTSGTLVTLMHFLPSVLRAIGEGFKGTKKEKKEGGEEK